jgi:hypothetical protein
MNPWLVLGGLKVLSDLSQAKKSQQALLDAQRKMAEEQRRLAQEQAEASREASQIAYSIERSERKRAKRAARRTAREAEFAARKAEIAVREQERRSVEALLEFAGNAEHIIKSAGKGPDDQMLLASKLAYFLGEYDFETWVKLNRIAPNEVRVCYDRLRKVVVPHALNVWKLRPKLPTSLEPLLTKILAPLVYKDIAKLERRLHEDLPRTRQAIESRITAESDSKLKEPDEAFWPSVPSWAQWLEGLSVALLGPGLLGLLILVITAASVPTIAVLVFASVTVLGGGTLIGIAIYYALNYAGVLRKESIRVQRQKFEKRRARDIERVHAHNARIESRILKLEAKKKALVERIVARHLDARLRRWFPEWAKPSG